MAVGFRFIGGENCEVRGGTFVGMDAGGEIVDSSNVKVTDSIVVGGVAVRGKGNVGLTFSNLVHTEKPDPSLLSQAVRRAAHGDV